MYCSKCGTKMKEYRTKYMTMSGSDVNHLYPLDTVVKYKCQSCGRVDFTVSNTDKQVENETCQK